MITGSLAKGTSDNVAALVEQGVATELVELLKVVPINSKMTEAVACALRNIFLHPPAPVSVLSSDMRLLTKMTRE